MKQPKYSVSQRPMQKLMERTGTWMFLAPTGGIALGKGLGSVFSVIRLGLVPRVSIPYIHKRLGFKKRISDLPEKQRSWLKPFLQKEHTFLHGRLTGKGADVRRRFLKIAKDELYIMALSQMGYCRRRNTAYPSIASANPHGKVSFLLSDEGTGLWTQPNYLTGKFMTLSLDKRWHRYHRFFFFHKLLKILRKEIYVKPHWRCTLYDASVLAGMSQCSSELPSAFLWNMIAIEMLLTARGDKYSKMLPERAEAFLGWTVDWRKRRFQDRIRELYDKRCKLVHEGNRDVIEVSDILFADELLFNLLNNLVRHHKLFTSRRKVVEFSERIRAEKLLKLKSKTQPKTLSFTRKRYRPEDFEKI